MYCIQHTLCNNRHNTASLSSSMIIRTTMGSMGLETIRIHTALGNHEFKLLTVNTKYVTIVYDMIQ